MKDPKIMAVLESINQLYECRFYKPVVVMKEVLFGDGGK